MISGSEGAVVAPFSNYIHGCPDRATTPESSQSTTPYPPPAPVALGQLRRDSPTPTQIPSPGDVRRERFSLLAIFSGVGPEVAVLLGTPAEGG